MRVIAGSARRILLDTPKGNDTRPTTDKTKETLFNCLMPYLSGAKFLDLFSGSGAIGIEALSRGAKNAVFIEKSREAINCINSNIKKTHFDDKSTILKGDVLSLLSTLENKGIYDIVFMDPPFGKEYERDVLYYLSSSKMIDEDTIIVVEASNETDFSYLEEISMTVFKTKNYKNHQHLFLRKVN